VRDVLPKPVMTNVKSLIFLTSLLLAVVSPLSAQPAKAKDATTKASSVTDLKPVAATDPSTASSTVDPATCIKPEDVKATQAPVSDEKSSPASPVAKAEAGDDATAAEPVSDSDANFMKDKLKLMLGGKSAPAPDQPQQCVIDEAREK
jgi:hypothetical protein